MKHFARIVDICLALLLSTALLAQEKASVKGKVTDKAGEPVPGAVIMLDGDLTAATMTDMVGQ